MDIDQLVRISIPYCICLDQTQIALCFVICSLPVTVGLVKDSNPMKEYLMHQIHTSLNVDALVQVFFFYYYFIFNIFQFTIFYSAKYIINTYIYRDGDNSPQQRQ